MNRPTRTETNGTTTDDSADSFEIVFSDVGQVGLVREYRSRTKHANREEHDSNEDDERTALVEAVRKANRHMRDALKLKRSSINEEEVEWQYHGTNQNRQDELDRLARINAILDRQYAVTS